MHQFNHVKLDALNFDLKAETTETGRLYLLPNGVKYPSVTTILSSGNKKELFEWRKRVGEEEANRIARRASARGTSLHTVCESFLLNKLTEVKFRTMMPTTKELFMQLNKHLIENIGNVYCIEQSLYSHNMQIAGKVDCIAEWKGKLCVVDFKTSTRVKDKEKISNYFMQCSAYAAMFTELTGIEVEDIVVAIAVEENNRPQIFEEKKSRYIDLLKRYINEYRSKTNLGEIL